MVSGSRDASLRVWDIETGKCKQILQGHIAAVRWQELFVRLFFGVVYIELVSKTTHDIVFSYVRSAYKINIPIHVWGFGFSTTMNTFLNVHYVLCTRTAIF